MIESRSFDNNAVLYWVFVMYKKKAIQQHYWRWEEKPTGLKIYNT